MKSFRDFAPGRNTRIGGAVLLAVAALAFAARAELPQWIRDIEAKSAVEQAFFGTMHLPYGDVLFRKPPAETRPALGQLIRQQPANADLYSLRALEDEQQLDFAAAERDWKEYADRTSNQAAARWDLADFYHRRLRPQDEIDTLRTIGSLPSSSGEKFTAPAEQDSWKAFERILGIIQAQGLGEEPTIATYRAWIARYPQQDGLYTRFLDYLLDHKRFGAANQLIASYQKQFPGDGIFPVKANALLEYRQGSIQQGLAVYEKSFQPLWQPELVKGYFDLLAQTQGLRKFLDHARADLNKNPEDLNATARVFYYYQQQGKLDAAQQAVTALRMHKEAAISAWSPQELYVCGRLLEDIHAYPEAARYYFALYNSKGAADSQERALARLTDMLLSAPESSIRLGDGDLAIYKDIGTIDPGPGYLNGILSLILNTTEPESAYPEEEQRAVSYFHRSRAVELLGLLDKNFPNAPSRPELHAKVIEFYSNNGQSEAVLQSGKEFLGSFPKSPDRTRVALLMADADQHLGKTQDEFGIYDAILRELAAQADKVPLGNRVAGAENFGARRAYQRFEQPADRGAENEGGAGPQDGSNSAFSVGRDAPALETGPRSAEYSRVLELYLARLVEMKQIPEALGVLRREIDRNPDDPGLYERLAMFLEQNNLTAEQEQVYRRAFARFSDPSWYSKLARLYLRYRRYSELEILTQDAVKQFDGSVLEKYFSSVGGSTPALYLRLNQYANERFPHNLFFVKNLLRAYNTPPTIDRAAWLALIRQHWFETPDLRDEYFEYLSSSNQLETELSALRRTAPASDNRGWAEFAGNNPAAATELAEAEIWRSHFEQSAPVLKSLAELYPAEEELDQTASSVFRSLAYFDPSKTEVAARIEANLLVANPGDTGILARIGDIYSDRELFQQAAPYWERIPTVAPGQPDGYLDAATIYWDYFDFGNALRLLERGRKKLANPTLYGYEEGAIYETQGDYSGAIREYAAAALGTGEDSPATVRLLELARRAKFRDEVSDLTDQLVTQSHDSLPAIHLRMRVLEAENRGPEMATLLSAALDRAETIEQAAAIESIAASRSIESVRQKALEKQATLATDPVNRMQLRYALVQFYENKKDFGAARRNMEALYQSNPKILGVVRSMVDFYWRAKAYPEAMGVLQQAAKDAHPQLSIQFTFEAARKSTEAKNYQQARTLLQSLLNDSPYNREYLAAMADTYSREGDAQGLKQFYLQKIALFRAATFTVDERKEGIATLRRGLIPALTQLNEYPGAVDQYIELINNFPEDEGLATEAALYAQRYHCEKQLHDFYATTIQQSPRDYRWPMALARMQGNWEDFSGAIDSYGKAITIRPDRTDLHIARAKLEERLLRFDDAAGDYGRLYQLSYKDPQWMEKIAEVRARQGRDADAVAALKTALIDAAPPRPSNYFEVARRLEPWGILEPARTYAEQGVAAAGDELLASPENHDGAKLYTRIMTRLRQEQQAYTTLQDAMKSASNPLPVLKLEIGKEGIAGISDSQWRAHLLATRQAVARDGMRAALAEMGTAAARYFTPEEKSSLADFARTLRAPMSSADTKDFALPLVQAAGMADQEARWRYELLQTSSRGDLDRGTQLAQFVQLQRRRLKFAELGSQLEKLPAGGRPELYAAELEEAAHAYRAAGDEDDELRLLTSLGPNRLGGADQTRWFTLLLKKNPSQLTELAGSWSPWGQQAADFAVANGDAALAHAVVAARSQARSPVWQKSYSALVGLYFAEASLPVNAAFVDALGDQTIGDRIGKPVDRNARLAGDIWYYYASRYGEHLAGTKQAQAEDFLPAELERSPASVDPHLSLGDFYFDQGENRKAIEQYNYALEFSPTRADVHDKLALAYYQDKDRAEAIAEWKLFFSAQLNQVTNARLADDFWSDFGRACDHVRSRGLFTDVKPEIDKLLRAYLRRNGNYRSNAVLQSAFLAQGDPSAGTTWLLDLSLAAPDPTSVLEDIVETPWVPLANRGPLYQRIIDALQATAAKTEGSDQESAQATLWSWQVRWVHYLVEAKQYSRAADAIDSLRKAPSNSDAAALVPEEIVCAAKLGKLAAAISGFKSDPESAPSSESLRAAAKQLLDGGDRQSARTILEFVFARELDTHQLVPANFLGLAEIRLADGDAPGAVALLKRLALVADDPYQNMDSSAALFEKTGHPAEAVEFLKPLAECTPWEPSFRLRLAKAEIAWAHDNAGATASLSKLATATENPYEVRVQAATALDRLPQPRDFGSAELKLLAAGPNGITSGASDHPFFYDSRLAAALTSSNPVTRMEILGKALADSPSRDDARVPFFRAAVSNHQDQVGLASIEQRLQAIVLGRISESDAEDNADIVSADPTEDGATGNEGGTAPALALQPAQQARLAHEIGLAMIRVDRLGEAQPYLEIARRLEPSPAGRKAAASDLLELRARLRRQCTNAARQPILHADLEQDRLVRPRLLSQNPAPAAGGKP